MTRPDVETMLAHAASCISGQWTNTEVAELCHYALAMEAAAKIVMGCQHPTGEGQSFDCTRCAFDAAVAWWEP